MDSGRSHVSLLEDNCSEGSHVGLRMSLTGTEAAKSDRSDTSTPESSPDLEKEKRSSAGSSKDQAPDEVKSPLNEKVSGPSCGTWILIGAGATTLVLMVVFLIAKAFL